MDELLDHVHRPHLLWLMQHGFDMRDVNKPTGPHRDTPMHLACREGNLARCQWLRARGARLSELNVDGNRRFLFFSLKLVFIFFFLIYNHFVGDFCDQIIISRLASSNIN